MASRPSLRGVALSLLTTLLPTTDALRASPSSPCSSVCADPDISSTDPQFYNKQWAGVVCEDGEYESVPRGQKAKSCLSCLETSTYTGGSESDQDWFLYNLRYSFDYCMFGYPNATGFHTNPCMTSEACGSLTPPLEQGITHPTQSEYAYCDAGDGVITDSDAVDRCLQCVAADEQHYYISNFLVALNGACQTKPSPNTALSLNATVFSNQIIRLVDPAHPASSSSDSTSSSLTTAAIAGIVVGALVFLALVSGCVFMVIRKRKNRASRRDKTSALEWHCQNGLSPLGHPMHHNHHPDYYYYDERFFTEKSEPTGLFTPAGIAVTTHEILHDHHSLSTPLQDDAPLARDDHLMFPPTKPRVITTTLPPPSPAHISPRAFSPDDYATPSSTVSTRSNAPLLGRVPLSATSSRAPSSPGFAPSSPLMPQSSWSHASRSNAAEPLWEEEASHHRAEAPKSPRMDTGRKRSKASIVMGDPVESQQIQTSFPPPPKR